jgi:hypothetical protein
MSPPHRRGRTLQPAGEVARNQLPSFPARGEKERKTMAAPGRFVGGVGFAAALVFVLGACGGASNVSATSLEPRLLPASSLPGFNSVGKLDWSNPVDLAGQGVALPESTYPTAAVKEFKSAHLEGAAGEVLRQGFGPDETNIWIGVAEFDSASDAANVRNWMHVQDLQQPCLGACVYRPLPLKLSGVPDSAAVIQTLFAAQPPKPANYRAEFTIGKYLYWAWFSADSRAKTKSEFEAGVGAYYQHATKQKS